jgi:ribosomal protein S18 acetylase RimI-like enzyme
MIIHETCRDKIDIYLYLVQNDKNMIPPLSCRVNLEKYSEKIYKFAQQFWFEIDGEFIGFAACYIKEKLLYVTTISIVYTQKGRGFGSKLMQYLIDYCKRKALTQIDLQIQIENFEVVKFYNKFGFLLYEKNGKCYMHLKL